MESKKVLTPQEAALYIGYSIHTLKAWRAQGIGPKFVKAGSIRYRVKDLEAWLDEKTVTP